MVRSLNKWTLFTLCGLIAAPGLMAQESGSSEAKVVIQESQTSGSEQDQDIVISGKANIKIDGGKIIIVDSDGKKQVIDIAGAKSIAVRQSSKTTNQDGDKETKTTGKAIIIGPDGVRREIELGGAINLGDLDLDSLEGLKSLGGLKVLGDMESLKGLESLQGLKMFDNNGELKELLKGMHGVQIDGNFALAGDLFEKMGAQGKYLIGVTCQQVPESLRAHLDLDQGKGLLVQTVSEDSAASAAGLKKHDLLISAGDTELNSVEALIAAVQAAGESDSALSLVGIRGGKEIEFKIKPTERPAQQIQWQQGLGNKVRLPMGKIRSTIKGGADTDELRDEIEKMRNELLELHEQLKKDRDNNSDHDDAEGDR